MGKRFCTGAKTHAFAEVISTLFAIIAMVAHDAGFDSNSLAWNDVFYASPNGSDDACCFVAENHGCLYSKITISSVKVIVHW